MEASKLVAIVLALVELIVTIFVVMRIRRVVARYRELRGQGMARVEVIENALTVAMPRLAAKLVTTELRLYRIILSSLGQAKSKDMQYLTARDTFKFVAIGLTALTAIEAVVIEVAVPARFNIAKIVLIVLTLWALVYIGGFYAALAQVGHRLRPDGIQLGVGFALKGLVPYADIESITKTRKDLPSMMLGPAIPKDEPGVLYATAGEVCNVAIALTREIVLDGLVKPFKPCTVVYLSLLDPDSFVEAVSEAVSNLKYADATGTDGVVKT